MRGSVTNNNRILKITLITVYKVHNPFQFIINSKLPMQTKHNGTNII